MEQVRVRIKTTVITAQYGTLETGTELRTSPAFAKHLVEEAMAAEYIAVPAVEKVEAPAAKPKSPRKAK